MGRSVATPSDAAWTLFVPLELEPELDDDFGFHDDIMCEDLEETTLSHFKSVYRVTEYWLDRECRVFAENGLGVFAISSYCGLYTLSFVPHDDERVDLATHWADSVRTRFFENWPNRLYKLGNMSNGVGVYKRASA